MLNESTQRDAAHLGMLTSAAQAYELWHNAQVEAIHKRMIRRRMTEEKVLEFSALAVAMPSPSVFGDFRDIDAELRRTTPSNRDDRRMIAEIRAWLHDSMSDLCDFELDHAISLLDLSTKQLDWLVNGKSRAGDRRNRLLDGESAARLVNVLIRVQTLLSEVTRVRALVAA
jgi:hypothetical protein